ncbi:MAG TPA: c-type cytochrome biogenesis protein CcsB [Micromonosporaceae bacterium]|jgi:cytochrome c-type biogenesis protein CcsB|nr:c-type cytochrome biogenesis protein CcsB [Micromonosporaceae bacterium]
MAALSDQLLTVAVLCYALAMLGHAVEYAFGNRRPAARTDARSLVTVGRDTTGSGSADVPGGSSGPVPDPAAGQGFPADREALARRADLTGWAALWLTVLGAFAQAGCLVARGLAADRVPWGNMYEFTIATGLVGVVAWLVLAFRRPIRHLGLFVTLAVVLLLGFAAVRLYSQAGPLVPALNSYWLKIHVTAAVLATGIFMVGFVAALLYLIRDRHDDAVASGRWPRFPVSLGAQLPDPATLERMAFRLHALAFPIWTFAIMAGAIWAQEAWTRYWGWDPKETWAFISWVVYAAYLHARATAGWRRSTAAWIAIAGWTTMLINLFVVNLVIEGLHSYSGT